MGASGTVTAWGYNGFGQAPVTVDWNRSDGTEGSGIDPDQCTTSSISGGEGHQILQSTCTDHAGNTGEAQYTVKVDTVLPALAPVPGTDLGGTLSRSAPP